MSGSRRVPEDVARVSTLELFFDLVFVFTVTQLTDVLLHEFDFGGLAKVLLMFGVIWWMYGAYAWLTNTVAPTRPSRELLLLVAMAGFLVIALAVPHGFAESGTAFGLGYLLVTVVHTVMYLETGPQILKTTPFNVASALLVLWAGAVEGGADYALWGLAMAIQVVTPYLSRIEGFRIQPAHFVERHGLLVIVVLGESIVAIGIGASGLPVDARVVTAATLGLTLTACLWWTYFGTGDDRLAERAMHSADAARQPVMAVQGFFYAHIPMMLGIVAMAAGVRTAMGHAFDDLGRAPAIGLAGGVAAFYLGDVAFRRVLGIGSGWWRAGIAALALGTIPLAEISAVTQLAGIAALLVVMLAWEQRRAVLRT